MDELHWFGAKKDWASQKVGLLFIPQSLVFALSNDTNKYMDLVWP